MRATHMWGRRGVETYALSGIDIALWNLMGKTAEQPVHPGTVGGAEARTYGEMPGMTPVGVGRRVWSTPRRMDLGQFLDEIAVEEGPGVTEEQAGAHTLAALSVLRDIVPDKEYRDKVAQLPKEYSAILPG